MKGSVCLLEFNKIDTKCKLHGLWFTLTANARQIQNVWWNIGYALMCIVPRYHMNLGDMASDVLIALNLALIFQGKDSDICILHKNECCSQNIQANITQKEEAVKHSHTQNPVICLEFILFSC